MDTIQIFSDGGARGNPGPAGIGVVCYDVSNRELWKYKKYIGNKTNNQAEYIALIHGLERALSAGAKRVDCFLDSELVTKQMKREYRVKNKDLESLFVKAWNLTTMFFYVRFFHIRREKNKIADSLVNEALDEHLKPR